MKKIMTAILLAISFGITMIDSAKADVFAWKDPKFEISMAYPDDWMAQAVEGDRNRLHIVAPQGQDMAACRIMASNDGRFLYVPPKGAVAVSQKMQDEKTLQGIFANYLHYDNVTLGGYQDVSSLGKGAATMALARFNKSWNGKTYDMQGIVFGGYVQGLETVFECEAMASAWGRWEPVFLNMVSTFHFPPRTAALKNGYYRDFMADGYVFFPVGNHDGKAMY